MEALKDMKSCVADALGNHAIRGVRASSASLADAVDQAVLNMRSNLWSRCQQRANAVPADEAWAIVDAFVHNLAVPPSIDQLARVLGSQLGIFDGVDYDEDHYYDGDDQYWLERVRTPLHRTEFGGKDDLIAMLLMITVPLDCPVLTPWEDRSRAMELNGSIEVETQRYGSDVFGVSHPEYTLIGTLQAPLLIPSMLLEVIPGRVARPRTREECDPAGGD